ncbi:PBSX family phage terminase large subunit [Enterococcus cecorum]|uniref:PBSX family phage terminase large subunit n=2 Tax=Enterococcus cecorum TaxID=44008 RepID=UPI001FAE5CB8|nr:PBSX family phage terminase large subunit [Enterococcus cecorum]MCJ0552258.1 PBSX family phage terminase large subunit [Enterococcus cecorum]MCJ0557786.1 PBSX family phage terminase large subunit [Enterococcus cecorum]MCJ0562587.1 PBSX family phage terminase large subunit [Enterococcus cecorum]MCJ0597293.1 PBSX family phage terminase large subunit [Enterococcus cecorum]
MAKVFNVQKNVNPHFKSVWKSQKPYNILKGGRNSFKSSVIALLLVYKMLQFTSKGKQANVVVIRKVGNTIRDSVYNKIQWALSKFGIMHQFNPTVSPFKIVHKKTGSTFYFYGQDDFQKLKSNDIGNIIAVWYEEAAEFKDAEEFDQSNVTFMRQKRADVPFVQFLWSYNPPRNPYNWINEWAEQMKTQIDYLVHESSYLDDSLGFVTDQMLKDINRIKENDYDYYRYLYLGEAVGLGANVYNMNCFHPLKGIPSDDKLLGIAFGLDAGHQQSATACCAFAITAKDKVILLDTFYYSPHGKAVKKAPSELSVMLHEFTNKVVDEYKVPIIKMTIDSAEGALRNQYLHDFGIRWHPVTKLKNQTMIDTVTSLLAEGRFFYLDNEANKIFIDEHKTYRYEEKTLHTDDPKVVKEDDHTCDAFKYFVLDNAKLLELKV